MKRCFILLFISWMFFPLAGCYTNRQLTFEQLKDNEYINNIHIISKNRQEYYLINSEKKNLNKPECFYCVEWKVLNDSLTMTCLRTGYSKVSAKSNGVDQEKFFLSRSDIAIIDIEEFDTKNTIFLIGIPVIIVTSMILLFKINGFSAIP